MMNENIGVMPLVCVSVISKVLKLYFVPFTERHYLLLVAVSVEMYHPK